MKNLYLLFCIPIILLSCEKRNENKSITENEIRQNNYKDSLEIIDKLNKIEKARKDSVIEIEQYKAIGEIRFGMNKTEAIKFIKKFKKENEKTPPEYSYVKYLHIGEYQASKLKDYYYQGKLYEVNIEGRLINWENYDYEAPKQVNYITNVIKQKYGNPYLHYDLKPRYKLKKGYSYLINQWNIGKKRIEVRLEDSGTYYLVNTEIFLPEIRHKIEFEKEQKEKQAAKKAQNVF